MSQAIGLPSTPVVTTTWAPDNEPGGIVQVTVTCTVIPLTGVTFHGNFQVRSTAQMQVVN